MMVPHVTLYGKPDCPLCEEALAEIQLAAKELQFYFKEVNILENLDIYEEYKNNIPLVHLNGTEAFRYRLTADALKEALLRLNARVSESMD